MEYLLTAAQMKELDQDAIQKIGIPSLVLMENASRAVCTRIEEAQNGKRILIVAGVGNNGADGLCIFRILKIKGFDCDCLIVGDMKKATAEFQTQIDILQKLSIRFLERCDYHAYDVIVDALFGVGLKRGITGAFADIVNSINSSDAFVYAVDMPSGVSADDGSVSGAAVRADETVTFGYRKLGHICYPGKSFCGTVVVADIGYPNGLCEALKVHNRCCTTEDFARIPKRSPSGNNGTFGKILIIAGSEKYCGPAVLSCLAAYRMGAGMVKVVTHYSNKTALCTRIPEALCLLYGENETEVPYGEEFVHELEESIAWADAIAIGPGLSQDITAEHLVYDVLQKSGDKRLVMDADALNLISKMEEDEKKCLLDRNMILTPHIVEMSRLTELPAEKIKAHPKETAADYANAYGCVVVLKDAVTISTDGTNQAYNLSGNSGMAVAGSGDVLTGILAAACAWGLPLFQTAALGVFIHGMAGDAAADAFGMRAMTAQDIAENLTFLKEMVY